MALLLFLKGSWYSQVLLVRLLFVINPNLHLQQTFTIWGRCESHLIGAELILRQKAALNAWGFFQRTSFYLLCCPLTREPIVRGIWKLNIGLICWWQSLRWALILTTLLVRYYFIIDLHYKVAELRHWSAHYILVLRRVALLVRFRHFLAVTGSTYILSLVVSEAPNINFCDSISTNRSDSPLSELRCLRELLIIF
jgi:hypothetical protein